MTELETSAVIQRFNRAFVEHDAAALTDLIGEDCVMEAIQPAPDGARYEGREACLAFWRALANDRSTQFEPEEVTVSAGRATIRWRYRRTTRLDARTAFLQRVAAWIAHAERQGTQRQALRV